MIGGNNEMKVGIDKKFSFAQHVSEKDLPDCEISQIKEETQSKEYSQITRNRSSNLVGSVESSDLENILRRQSLLSKKFNAEDDILHSASNPNFEDIFGSAIGSGVEVKDKESIVIDPNDLQSLMTGFKNQNYEVKEHERSKSLD